MNAHNAKLQQAQTSELVNFWNEILAPKFMKYRHILVGGLSRHSSEIMPLLSVKSGDRVLDVGCGFGDTATKLARRVAPTGLVLGIDCCEAFIDQAFYHAQFSWTGNVHFVTADVEQGIDYKPFDFIFSRFGTMFFSNPVSGLHSIRSAMKPGAQFAHIVWRQRSDNPWLAAAGEVVKSFLPLPGESARNCGPGPFSMSEIDVTRAQMEAAGFTDIIFKRVDAKVMVGRDIEEAIAFQLALGPAGEMFREAGALAEERRPLIETALKNMFAEVEINEDGLWMDSSSWLITARNPE